MILPGEEDFGIVPVEAHACGRPVVALGRGGAMETVDRRRERRAVRRARCARRSRRRCDRVAGLSLRPRDNRGIARSASRVNAIVRRMREVIDETIGRACWNAMVRRYNRLLVACYVISDAVLAMWAFILAYGIRFESGLVPVTHGYPPFEQYVNVLPFIAVLTPLAFQLQGVYRLRRGRSRVDDFFAVLIGSILAVVLGVISTLVRAGLLRVRRSQGPRRLRSVAARLGALPGPQRRLSHTARAKPMRELLERRWRAGIGLKRILIAGAGDLGRMVADRILQHRELGYQVVGFVDDRAGGDHLGYRGLPLLGTLARSARSPSASVSIICTSRCRSRSTPSSSI